MRNHSLFRFQAIRNKKVMREVKIETGNYYFITCFLNLAKFLTLNCGFDYIHSASKHTPMDLIGVCEPSMTYSRVQVEAIDSFPKSPIKGALMVSRNSLLLQSKATSPEALCLRDLELCNHGMTISFWILALPASKSSKLWPILQQASLSGSEITVNLFRNDGKYFLDVSVKSLHTIVGGKATSKLWKVDVSSIN